MVIEAEKNIGITLTLIAFLAGAALFTIADMIAEKKEEGSRYSSWYRAGHNT